MLCATLAAAFGFFACGPSAHAATTKPFAGVSAQVATWVAAEADYLSHRQLDVTCVPDAGTWDAAVAAAGLAPAGGSEYYGFSLIAAGELSLSPYTCEGLALGLVPATRRANELQVAWSVDVLVHESIHMARHTADEALTEACARVGLPLELNRLFAIPYRSPEMTRLTADAALIRATMPDEYQGGTCPTP